MAARQSGAGNRRRSGQSQRRQDERMMAKVSVIIPVYNAEPYLKRCLDSVCNQTLKDIEIICVNDGSTDNSLEILRKYEKEDDRIKIVSFERNKGVSIARNTGIDAAQGEYIGFVDSDDYIDLDFYEKLYTKASESGAEIVKGEIKINNQNQVSNNNVNKCKMYFFYFFTTAIYKREFLKENKIGFPDDVEIGEDPIFSLTAAIKTDRIILLNDVFYHYEKNQYSATGREINPITINKYLKAYAKIINILNNEDLDEESYLIPFYDYFYTELVFLSNTTNDTITKYTIACVILYLFSQCKYKDSLVSKNCRPWYSCLTDEDALFDCFLNENITNDIDIKKLIESYDLIVFDIFDTLLVRPFLKPVDVFYYIEKKIINPALFASDRIYAEKRARLKKIRNNVEEVNLNDIYNELPVSFQKYKDLELTTEKLLIRPNPKVLEFYNYAINKKKRVFIISDMYLPQIFIENLLEKNGINHYEKIYLSSEIGLTKKTGKLFEYFIKESNAVNKKILHIGDNFDSDYISASNKGITPFYYRKPSTNFFLTLNNKRFLKFINDNSYDINVSIIFGIIILIWLDYYGQKEDFWYRIGYLLGGPLSFCFTQNVIEIAKTRNISDILFIARDCYVIKDLYEILKGTTTARGHYVYANRKIRYRCCTDYSSVQELSYLLKAHFPDQDFVCFTANQMITYYNDHKDIIIRQKQNSRDSYINYIKDLSLGDNILIVDSVCSNFSAMKLISQCFSNRHNCLGMFLRVNRNDYRYNYFALAETRQYHFEWNVVELLLTSPENPIEMICDNKPVYDIDSDYDMQRKNIYSYIYKGEMDFTKKIIEIYGNNFPKIDFTSMLNFMNYYFRDIPQSEKKYFNSVYHDAGNGYSRLLSSDKINTILHGLRFRVRMNMKR
jgi:HAD superfamily hydrolase (TIGR01549 family)